MKTILFLCLCVVGAAQDHPPKVVYNYFSYLPEMITQHIRDDGSFFQTAPKERVVVDFWVTKKGNVRDVTIVRTTNNKLAKLASKQVAEWKFEPGIQYGRAVDWHLQVPLMYELKDR